DGAPGDGERDSADGFNEFAGTKPALAFAKGPREVGDVDGDSGRGRCVYWRSWRVGSRGGFHWPIVGIETLNSNREVWTLLRHADDAVAQWRRHCPAWARGCGGTRMNAGRDTAHTGPCS